MALTRQQLEANIEAMESQGAPQADIQTYLDSLREQGIESENLLKTIVKEPIKTLLVKPAIRTGQAIGALGIKTFGTEEQKERLGEVLSKPTEIDTGLLGKHKIEPVESAKQIVGEAAKSAAFLTPAGGVGASIRTLAKLGGVSGALYGAGQKLEEGGELREAATGAIIGGALGIFAGATLPLGIRGIGAAGTLTMNAARSALKTLTPKTRQEAIQSLVKGLENSFLKDKPAVLNKIDVIAKGQRTNRQQLLSDFAEEGFVPKIEEKTANFIPVMDEISNRISAISESLDELLLKSPDRKIFLRDFLNRVAEKIQTSPQIQADLDKSLAELQRVGSSYQKKFGDEINLPVLNAIRKEMNERTKAFRDEKFMQDVSDSVADVARGMLDILIPNNTTRETNAQIAKLIIYNKIARLFHNRVIDVGIFSNQLGRYLGTVTLPVAVGGMIATGGPGGLVVAGIMAHTGGEVVARIMRNLRFNDKLRVLIAGTLQKDSALLERLMKETDKAGADFLKREAGRQLPESLTGLRSVIHDTESILGIPREKEYVGALRATPESPPKFPKAPKTTKKALQKEFERVQNLPENYIPPEDLPIIR